MKFLGMNMADALLLGIAAFILLVAAGLMYLATTSSQGEPMTAILVGTGTGFVAVAFLLAKRVVAHPLPLYEPAPDTSYRRKPAK